MSALLLKALDPTRLIERAAHDVPEEKLAIVIRLREEQLSSSRMSEERRVFPQIWVDSRVPTQSACEELGQEVGAEILWAFGANLPSDLQHMVKDATSNSIR
jgi:hypothetical protein